MINVVQRVGAAIALYITQSTAGLAAIGLATGGLSALTAANSFVLSTPDWQDIASSIAGGGGGGGGDAGSGSEADGPQPTARVRTSLCLHCYHNHGSLCKLTYCCGSAIGIPPYVSMRRHSNFRLPTCIC